MPILYKKGQNPTKTREFFSNSGWPLDNEKGFPDTNRQLYLESLIFIGRIQLLIFFQHLYDFTNKGSMEIPRRILLIQDSAIQKTFFLHILLIKLAANKHQFGFLIIRSRLIKKRSQSRLFVFVTIPTGYLAANGQGVPVFLLKKAHGIKILLFNEFQSISLGANMDGRNIAAPKLSQAAPAGSHGIMGFFVSSRNKHPALIDQGKRIDRQIFNTGFMK